MITRVWADLIDLWLAVAPFVQGGVEAWRRLPGDLLGEAVVRLCGGLAVSREIARADGPPAILVEDRRAARYLDHVPLQPYAQTLGRYIFAREHVSDTILRHELEHVRQWRAFGPLFLPLYGLASIRAILAGGDRYRDNVFEVAARAREAVAE
jgi:hypothetical protein